MTERRFDFDGRPDRRAIVDTITAALEDEGLRLMALGQSARIREVIGPDGRVRVYVPVHLITAGGDS